MRNIFVIWKKELTDTIRDKRTLMSMIVMPMVLMPLLIVGMGKFVAYQIQKSEQQTVTIGIANASAAPELVEFLKSREKLRIVETDGDLAAAVRDEQLNAAVVIPPDFERQLADLQPVTVEFFAKSTSDRSAAAQGHLTQAAAAFSSRIVASRISAYKLPETILSGVTFKPKDVTTEKERGGFGLGFLLPLFIVMWSVIGGQYTAIDASAGEKERKTLEALFLTPAKRMEIVLGKFLAVASVAMVSIVVSLGSMYLVVARWGFGLMQSGGSPAAFSVNFSIDPFSILLMFSVSVLLVFLFAAALLAISIFARSYKEAQSYIGPAYLVVILPVVLANTVPGFKPAAAMFFIPVLNAIWLFKEALLAVYDPLHIIYTFVSLFVCAAVAIIVATRIYSKESVLFKE